MFVLLLTILIVEIIIKFRISLMMISSFDRYLLTIDALLAASMNQQILTKIIHELNLLSSHRSSR